MVSIRGVAIDLTSRHLMPLSGSTILITGGTGLVGSYLVRSIVDSTRFVGVGPDKILVLCRSLPNPPSLLSGLGGKDPVEFLEWDGIRPPQNLSSIDILIHAASPASPQSFVTDPLGTFRANVNGLQNILEATFARHCSKALLISSGEVYGPRQPLLVSETFEGLVRTTDPRSIYAESKRAAESLIVAYSSTRPLEGSIARLFHTFGPGVRRDDPRIFGKLLWDAAHRRPLHLRSSGTAVRTFLDLADAVRGLLDVLNFGKGGVFNVGSSTPVTIREFVSLVEEICPSDSPRVDFSGLPEMDSYPVVPDASSLMNLGWNSTRSLPETIARTVEWILEVSSNG
jgi:dTDP-glucose 4,6-dehydratase